MKFINIKIVAIVSLLLITNCEKGEVCEFDSQCTPISENTKESGLTVVTYNAENPTDFVGAVFDTRNNASAPIGTDWAPSLGTAGKITKPVDWTLGKIGRVFGIAIDDNSNVYLASSGVYNQYFHTGALPYVNVNPFRIYKANAGTYSTSAFVDLPSSGSFAAGSVNGIGNITYDKVNKQFFATNLDDGKIYRISMAGAILQSYDPWAADSGTPDITIQNERIWGIGINYENGNVKVYFARIQTPSTSPANRNLYSLTLHSGGTIPSSAPNLEIPNLAGNESAITDIEFSSDTNKIILAERGNPHNAIVFSYNRNGNTWLFHQDYAVGGLPSSHSGKNSAGGVDFAYKGDDKNLVTCTEYIWASGNYLIPNGVIPAFPNPPVYIYGYQGISYSGNNISSIHLTDIYIDPDAPNYTWNTGIGKGDVGDIDVFDANSCTCIKK